MQSKRKKNIFFSCGIVDRQVYTGQARLKACVCFPLDYQIYLSDCNQC